jgi:hypothetical protein
LHREFSFFASPVLLNEFMHIVGVDFTSSPRKSKPITVAHGDYANRILHISHVDEYADWESYEKWLAQAGNWLGAFDFPFGLSRELVEHLKWPTQWTALVTHCASLSRADLRSTFKAFCDARPAGKKFAHRVTDGPAGSSPSMKWVNPPVAYMFQEGTQRLLRAGVTIPGLLEGDPHRIALEGYPGLIARAVTRASYKSDERAKHTAERRAARKSIIAALENGEHPLGIGLTISTKLRKHVIDDGSADWLDAILCAVAAAWASTQPAYGMPPWLDPLEGWTAAAPFDALS